MSAALLVDLGNHAWKWALLGKDGRWDEVQQAPARLGALPSSLMALAHQFPVRLSAVHPAIAAEFLAALPNQTVAVAGQPNWPLEVASQGTGSDRVLAGFAAYGKESGPCLIADCGTAWTLDLVAGDGVFQGGAIGPGLGLGQSALHSACPHLPLASGHNLPDFPNNSESAVEWGTRRALVATLESFALHFEQEFSLQAGRYLSGGDAALLAPLLGQAWHYEPHLVLQGLALWEPNS